MRRQPTAPSGTPPNIERDDREHLLTVDDVAALLRLTPKGIYSLVASRRIPFIRISNRVRFRREDIVTWLNESRVPSGVRR